MFCPHLTSFQNYNHEQTQTMLQNHFNSTAFCSFLKGIKSEFQIFHLKARLNFSAIIVWGHNQFQAHRDERVSLQ